jgi:hypothetical protein
LLPIDVTPVDIVGPLTLRYDLSIMAETKSSPVVFDKQPYRNIFVALVVVILIDALMPNVFARGRIADLMLATVMVVALVETVRTRHNFWPALILGLPAVLLRVVAAFTTDSPKMNTTLITVTALFMVFLIWNLLHDLAAGGRPTGERIFGALCAYVFIGLLFALFYAHMEYREPESFLISQAILGGDTTVESNLYSTFTYFSFVTLTTLGYGDITPVAEHARTLAWFEALLGQLYLAVMVAGFVAVHISERMSNDRGDSPSDK